jgi:L-rhamnose mutarotase
MSEKHLNILSRLMQGHGLGEIHKCIEDLVANGLCPERFSENETRPDRQDVTQYLASWCRRVGLSQEECTEWLVDYCQEVLAPLSRSSLSRIRHSTKSNIKYIYRDAKGFVCYGRHNFFKAACSEACPFYHEQMLLYEQYLQEKNAVKNYALFEDSPEERLAQQLQEENQRRFAECIKLIREKVGEGWNYPQIVSFLNKHEYKTRHGKPWNAANLRACLKKLGIKEPKRTFEQQFQEAFALIKTGREQGLTRPQILELLHKNGYKTRTGLEWNLGVLNLEIQKLRKQAGKAES